MTLQFPPPSVAEAEQEFEGAGQCDTHPSLCEFWPSVQGTSCEVELGRDTAKAGTDSQIFPWPKMSQGSLTMAGDLLCTYVASAVFRVPSSGGPRRVFARCLATEYG